MSGVGEMSIMRNVEMLDCATLRAARECRCEGHFHALFANGDLIAGYLAEPNELSQ
jgi:hypothetical protein